MISYLLLLSFIYTHMTNAYSYLKPMKYTEYGRCSGATEVVCTTSNSFFLTHEQNKMNCLANCQSRFYQSYVYGASAALFGGSYKVGYCTRGYAFLAPPVVNADVSDYKKCGDGKYGNMNFGSELKTGGKDGFYQYQTYCPPGKYHDDYWTKCQLCPVGTFNPEDTYTLRECISCPAGFYQSGTGNERCLVCPDGYSQTQEKSSKCDECQAGR